MCEHGGAGVDRDMERAAGFYQQAAEQGLVDAQFTLGVMHRSGQVRRLSADAPRPRRGRRIANHPH